MNGMSVEQMKELLKAKREQLELLTAEIKGLEDNIIARELEELGW